MLVDLHGKPLYLHGLEMLKEVIEQEKDCSLTVVSRYDEIRHRAEEMGIRAADSKDSEQGLSYTIQAGIFSLKELKAEDYLLFVVADQPYLTASSVRKLLRLADGRTETARLAFETIPGNPVLFSARFVPELLALKGDSGGGAVVKRHACAVVSVLDRRELMDIDTIKDLPGSRQQDAPVLKEEDPIAQERERPRHIVVTGKINSGKTTLVNAYLKKQKIKYEGFRTVKIDMTSAGPIYALEDIKTGLQKPISAFSDGRIQGIRESFDGFGAKVINDAVKSDVPVLLFDEIGRFERESIPFLHALNLAFESGKQIIAVLKKEKLPHIEKIKRRKDICFFDMDEISVEQALEQLIGESEI